MNVVAIIQARMGSTRLPGKVLADLGGRSMLARVVERGRRSATLHEIVVATTTLPTEEPLVEECRRLNTPTWRGSEDDVLDRYFQASLHYGADVVVRLTADCPLIDGEVVDVVVKQYLRAQPDYASNTLRRSWPRGLDTEVFSVSALGIAAAEAREPFEREHVTPYVFRHPGRFRLLPVVGPHELGDLRWTVDTAEDLAMVREVYRALGSEGAFGWREVLDLVREHPEIPQLNRNVMQKELDSG